MYCCETSNRPISHRYGLFQRMKCAMRRGAAPCKTFLKTLLAPETTSPPMMAGESEKIWFSAVKTLFWVANAIIVGIVMAKICC